MTWEEMQICFLKKLDCSANGTAMNLSPEEVWELVSDVAENTRYLPVDFQNISHIETTKELPEVTLK